MQQLNGFNELRNDQGAIQKRSAGIHTKDVWIYFSTTSTGVN
jgi:hypothetical protein